MKRFRCGSKGASYSIGQAASMGFCWSIELKETTEREVLGWLESLEVGEKLLDEDGDEWTRVA